ncbi:hypothetical protein C8R44DRAFT_888957 [Mycena epipterygia]|nr:hypothetical protein C8R44DRAFT_888957 [Mycena epipterygia]
MLWPIRTALSLSLWMPLVFAMKIPLAPASTHTVLSNFLGISFELSFIPNYLGNDSSTIPQPMVNYLAGIRARTGDSSVRVRIGGNSADSSTYLESQTTPMAVLNNPHANSDDESVNYGPAIWAALAKVAQMAGGVDYLIGMSLQINGDRSSDCIGVPLRDPNNTTPEIVGDAKAALGDNLDALLLGNEPDLYQVHSERPNIPNYTIEIYQDEFSNTVNTLQSTFNSFAGPTICCSWDLTDVFQAGYLSRFPLKYVTLQHYPQNFCPGLGKGKPRFGLPYYMQHSNVVALASWQRPGFKILTDSPRLVLTSVGYSAAYLHTRERGISYNLVTPPAGGNGAPGNWTTNPPYYALLAVAEALRTDSGGIVVDLDLGSSPTDQQAGYAVYDARNGSATRLVLFNYAAAPARFDLPASLFANRTVKSALVKFLVAASGARETTEIAWGGKTFAGVGDGLSAVDAAWAPLNENLECVRGCSFDASAVSLAVVFLDNAQFAAIPASPGLASRPSGPPAAEPSGSTNAACVSSAGHSGVLLAAVAAVFNLYI